MDYQQLFLAPEELIARAMEAERIRAIEADAWRVIEAFAYHQPGHFRRDWLYSVKRFVERLGLFETLAAMEIAYARLPYETQETYRFRYFCGICWNRIRQGEDE